MIIIGFNISLTTQLKVDIVGEMGVRRGRTPLRTPISPIFLHKPEQLLLSSG
jgi:hypothetical protein